MRLLLFTLCTVFAVSLKCSGEDQQAAKFTFLEHPHIKTSELSAGERHILGLLKPGMTRKQLSEYFAPDGGLIFMYAQRYFLRDTRLPRRQNTVVMLDFVFKPAAMNEATFSDPQRRDAWMGNHSWYPGKPNDIVKAFSKPYESGIAID